MSRVSGIQRAFRNIVFKAMGFPQARAEDESIWMGGRTWGSGAMENLKDPSQQIGANKGWVYICIGYNARNVASQKLRLYSTTPLAGGAKTKSVDPDRVKYLKKLPTMDRIFTKTDKPQEVTDHLFLDMMNRPSPIVNKSQLWWVTEMWMGLTGKCYWWWRPSALAGIPFQVWVLESDRTTPKRGQDIDEFIKYYEYRVPGLGVPKEFDPRYILFHRYPDVRDAIGGMSPVEGLSDSIKLLDKMSRYEYYVFKNMAKFSGILYTDEFLSDPKFRRMKREIKKYKGELHAEEMPLFEGGIKFKETSMKPKDLGHQEGRRQMREETADGFGIPMALLTPEGVSLANSRIAFVQYMRDTMAPKLRLYEEEINLSIEDTFGPGLAAAFDNCIPSDDDFNLRSRESRLKTGYSTINQEREEDGLEAQDGWGDLPIFQGLAQEFESNEERVAREDMQGQQEEERTQAQLAEEQMMAAAQRTAEIMFEKLQRAKREAK